MNPTTNTEAGAVADVAAIARRLPPAQKHAVKADGAFSLIVARRLTEAGLALSYVRRTGENFVRLEWTDLGLAVRQHLEQGATADD